MILANVEVAKIAAKKKHPVLYRCHMEPPAREINFLDKNRKKLHPRGFKVTAGTLHHWLNWLTDQGLNQPFHLNILSAMEPAFYTASNVGHFGLGEGLYLHFTSPIRRFPDLWNHIVLKALFFKDFRYNNLMESLKIFEAAEKSNFAEKRSVICEIVSHKLLNYSYLEKYGNDIFLGNFAYKKQKDLFFYVQGLPLILSAKKRGPFPYLGEPRELTNLRLSSEGFIRAELLD